MQLERIFDGPMLTPEEILQSRTERAGRQRERLASGCPCLVSFTLNIPGAVKQFPLAHAAFDVGLGLLSQELDGHITTRNLTSGAAGNEALLCVDLPPQAVKRRTAALEEEHALGRLFDIDVLDGAAVPVSRTALGLPPRRCLLCDREAKLCARAQAHSSEAVRLAVAQLLMNYFRDRAADQCAACATRALLYEVSVTPKPGLVDRANAGSHRDMDFFTFLDSSAALSPWFREFFCIGWDSAGQTASALFSRLRFAGKQAERAMFSAAGGANTHKGLIFSMGLLCGALGAAYFDSALGTERSDGACSESFPPVLAERVFRLCRELGECALSDFEADDMAETNGLRCFRAHQITGVRGQAAQGFPSVREIGIPNLHRWTAQGYSLNDAGAMTLLALLAAVTDTNMIRRGGSESARRRRAEARELLERIDKDSLHAKLSALDWAYQKENLSPGGSADLLALSFMAFFLEREGLLSP